MRVRYAAFACCCAVLLSPLSAAAAIFPEDAFSNKAAGTTAAGFLKFPAGVRVEGLGGSSAAAVEGAEAVFYNPAGIGASRSDLPSELVVGYSNLLSGANAGSIAYARTLGRDRQNSLGVGLVYFAHGGQTAYDAMGDPVGDFTPSDFALSLSFARVLGRTISVGAGVKMIRSALHSESSWTGAVDLGVQFLGLTRLGDGPVDLGASVTNLGKPLRLRGVSHPLPLHLRGGILWHLNPVLKVAADGNLPVDDDPYVSLGVEARFRSRRSPMSASLRGGFDHQNTRGIDGFTGASFGGGVELGRLRVDYAWVPFGDLGRINRVSLAARF